MVCLVKHGPKAQSVPGRDPPQSSATVSRLGSCANWQKLQKEEEVPKIRRRFEDIQVRGGTLEVDSKVGSSKWRFLRGLEGWGLWFSMDLAPKIPSEASKYYRDYMKTLKVRSD